MSLPRPSPELPPPDVASLLLSKRVKRKETDEVSGGMCIRIGRGGWEAKREKNGGEGKEKTKSWMFRVERQMTKEKGDRRGETGRGRGEGKEEEIVKEREGNR